MIITTFVKKRGIMKGIFEKKESFGYYVAHKRSFVGFPPMFHNHCEIVYVVSGEIRMTVDDKERALRRGEMCCVFPYVVHSYENAPEAEFYIILFEPDVLNIFESELASKKLISPYIEGCEVLEPLFSRTVEYGRSPVLLKNKIAISYISVILAEIINRSSLCDADSRGENMIKPILSYCAEHFSDEDISMKKIANALYISHSYVSKVFATKLKYGFREYINELRISKAKSLLKKTDMQIVTVMLECGFKNQSSFNRIFSATTGVTPREYRKQSRN